MAGQRLPADTTELVLHVSDRSLTPIFSATTQISSSTRQPLAPRPTQALSSLTTNAITVFDCASRLGMGTPQRIMIETESGGPIAIHSFLGAQSTQRSGVDEGDIVEQTRNGLRTLDIVLDTEINDEYLPNGDMTPGHLADDIDAEIEHSNSTPSTMLIASVIAPSAAQATDARRAATRLEIEFRREFTRQTLNEDLASGPTTVDDG